MSDLYDILEAAVCNASILRLVVRLLPAMSDGLVYPPTYENGQHIFRPAWIEGSERNAVLLDSVQSQANRVELALLDAYRRKKIWYPDIELKVNARTGKESYSILQLSHRIYDAALRLSLLDEIPFADSPVGKAVFTGRTERANSLFTHAPITLVLGGWDSHGGGGPMVAKIPRLLTSEIIGLDAKKVERGAVKFDPMDIRKDAGPVYESTDPIRLFEIDKERLPSGVKPKEKKPSEIGLGNVPNYGERGAVITEAIQTSIISCTAARRLRFEKQDDSYDDARDTTGQTVVVALGLYGLLAQMIAGYNLRSGCDLIPKQEPTLEVMGQSLQDISIHPVSTADAHQALQKALDTAKSYGLAWRNKPIELKADSRLVSLIERSRMASNTVE